MKKVWLIGASLMAQDYIKVLNDLDVDLTVIGRGKENAKICERNTSCEVLVGGIDNFLLSNPKLCDAAIVSVGVEALFETTKKLLSFGVKSILVEKPGALRRDEFSILQALIEEKNASVFIAYNRRFFASVLKAKEVIVQDGGVISFNFEFTEWSHVIEGIVKAVGIKDKWFLANSTHVVDMAFYLGGSPREIQCYTSGELSWHPSASNFSGAGISRIGALFNYQANWESAGRWSVEILTAEHRLIFRPMEKLQIQKRGTIAQVYDESIDYSLDEKYKPGLYLQTKYFLEHNTTEMCSLQEQFEMMPVYNKIANYKD